MSFDIGTTESGGLATFTGAGDMFLGSSGSLLPTVQARLANEDGTIIAENETPGEVLLKSPSVVAGYLDGKDEDLMTPDGWLRTGDVGLFRKGPEGNDHLFIVDRLKDMLKVKVRWSELSITHHTTLFGVLTTHTIHRVFKLLQQTLKLRCYATQTSWKPQSLATHMSYRESEPRLSSFADRLK